MTREPEHKLDNLRKTLNTFGRVAVAFSVVVDSTFLLKVAHDTLADNAIAITAQSKLYPKQELGEAIEFCKTEGIRHIIMDFNALDIDGLRDNPPNRCYLCKYQLFTQMLKKAYENQIDHLIEGSNVDDEGDYRPGLKALKELNIISPLRIAGLTKSDIRVLSREFELPTWSKPSFACLASRFVYGEQITEQKLKMVDDAEQCLKKLGFIQFRVRIHDMMARIEVYPEDMEKIIKHRTEISEQFKLFGFTYVSLDLQGYRTGSMNEVLS